MMPEESQDKKPPTLEYRPVSADRRVTTVGVRVVAAVASILFGAGAIGLFTQAGGWRDWCVWLGVGLLLGGCAFCLLVACGMSMPGPDPRLASKSRARQPTALGLRLVAAAAGVFFAVMPWYAFSPGRRGVWPIAPTLACLGGSAFCLLLALDVLDRPRRPTALGTRLVAAAAFLVFATVPWVFWPTLEGVWFMAPTVMSLAGAMCCLLIALGVFGGRRGGKA